MFFVFFCNSVSGFIHLSYLIFHVLFQGQDLFFFSLCRQSHILSKTYFHFQYSKYFSKLSSFISWMFFVVMPPSHQCCLFLIHSSFNGKRYSLAWNLFSSGSCTVWKRLDSFTRYEAKSLVLKNLASQVCVPSASYRLGGSWTTGSPYWGSLCSFCFVSGEATVHVTIF